MQEKLNFCIVFGERLARAVSWPPIECQKVTSICHWMLPPRQTSPVFHLLVLKLFYLSNYFNFIKSYLPLDLVFFYFSPNFPKVEVLVTDLRPVSSLTEAFSAIIFPLNTDFSASYKCWVIIFLINYKLLSNFYHDFVLNFSLSWIFDICHWKTHFSG